jgi:hypothetical protein
VAPIGTRAATGWGATISSSTSDSEPSFVSNGN